MTSTPSVVVVGAGALGLCTAYHLADRGVDVTVIERDHVAGASSGLSVGIIETQYLDPLAIEIRVESMRFFTELERSRRARRHAQRVPAPRAPGGRHGGVRAERRDAAVAGRRRLPRPRARRAAPADPGPALRRPRRRPLRAERRLHRRPPVLQRPGRRCDRPGRPRAAGYRARRLRSAARRSEPAPDEPGRPRVRRRGECGRRLGAPRRRHPRRAGSRSCRSGTRR